MCVWQGIDHLWNMSELTQYLWSNITPGWVQVSSLQAKYHTHCTKAPTSMSQSIFFPQQVPQYNCFLQRSIRERHFKGETVKDHFLHLS